MQLMQRRESGPQAIGRSRPSRLRMLAYAVAAFVVVVVGLGAFFYYAVLPKALAPRLVEALEARLGPGHTARVGSVSLSTAEGRVALEVEELSITGPDGREVAFAPEGRVELDRGALFGGEVALRSLHLDRPRLVLRSLPEATQEPPLTPEAPVSPTNRDLLAHLVGTLDRLTSPGGAAAALDEVRVTSATLNLDRGAGEGNLETLDRLSVRLARNPQTNGFAATISSEGSVDRWSATLTSSAPLASGRVFDLGLNQVSLATAGRLGGLGKEPDFDATISGHVSIRLDSEAGFQAGEARLDLTDLSFLLPGPKKARLAFEQAQIRARWDGETRTLRLEPSVIAGGTGRATFVGEARAPAAGSSDPWAIALQAVQAQLPGEAGDPPLRLDNMSFRAAWRPESSTLELQEGHIVGPTVNVALSGGMTFGDSSPAITLGLAAAPTTVSAVKRLWPWFVAIPIREWFVESVEAGALPGFSMTVDIKQGVLANLGPYEPLPDQAIFVESRFTDAAILPQPGLPKLAGANGQFRASGRRVEMVVDSAQVASPSGGALGLRGKFEVPNTEPRFPGARVALTIEGALTDVAQLFASGQLGPNPMPPGIEPAQVRGSVSAQSLVSFTLGPKDQVPPLEVTVDGNMKDVVIDKLLGGKPLEAGQFRVVRDSSGASLIGDAKIGGAVTSIELRDEGLGGRREVLASTTLDAAARNRLGFPGGSSIKGPIGLKIKAPLGEGPVEVQADLAGADIDGLVPGLRKRAGAAGKMTLTLVKTDQGTTVRDLAIDSGATSIKGNVELDSSGAMTSARLGTFKLSPGDDARVSVEKSKSATKVAIAGSSLDLKPFMADLFAGDTGEATAPDLDLDVALDSAGGHNGETASGLKLSLVRRDGQLKTLEMKSDRFGAGRVRVDAIDRGGGHVFTGDDAGSFLRFLNIYSKAYGGRFRLKIASTAKLDGDVEVDGFQVRGERALASVTSTDRLRTDPREARTSREEPGRPAGESNVQFTKLKMRFVRNGGKLLLEDVVVWGPQIGLTVEGSLDFSADRVNVTGTFVPAYALNNLFSKLPVIGFFLGGGTNEGLFAVTFRVTGALANPTLTINPMSAVAPGFLRKLFEFRNASEGTAAADSGARSNVQPR